MAADSDHGVNLNATVRTAQSRSGSTFTRIFPKGDWLHKLITRETRRLNNHERPCYFCYMDRTGTPRV